MVKENPGIDLDLNWLNRVNVNLTAITYTGRNLVNSRKLDEAYRVAWLLRAITFMDLTTLNSDDTLSNIERLCCKARYPLPEDLLNSLGFKYNPDCPIRTAAICVYPSRVRDVYQTLKTMRTDTKINIASVATGFPSGQTPFEARTKEIEYAINNGAKEIDIVIDRNLVLTGKWSELYQEIREMKQICGDEICMKTILGVGELGTLNNVYKASLVAMMAGSDFIKTSTGKESLNATITFGIVMCRAIREFYNKTGYKVGLKPAGGIRTSDDAISWLILVKELLGDEWLNNSLFRIGASGLLGNIECDLYQCLTNYYPAKYEFTVV